jgi:glycine/D-amino acid oxidase-like deaminating enzyme
MSGTGCGWIGCRAGRGDGVETVRTDVLVIGAGIVGVSVAYALKKAAPGLAVALVDWGQPLSFTSAQSGEKYRNWWPHPVMKRFTDRSIDLMEEIARTTGERIALTRRGYVLATRRASLDGLLAELGDSYGSAIRVHSDAAGVGYAAPDGAHWAQAPWGVDVLDNQRLIRRVFPWLDDEVRGVIHIRRGGTVSGQQLGQVMLERFRDAGGRRISGEVVGIDPSGGAVRGPDCGAAWRHAAIEKRGPAEDRPRGRRRCDSAPDTLHHRSGPATD